MNLPDPEASCAVLIGTDSYRDLEPLPAVSNNLERLRQLFTSPDLWGLAFRRCIVAANPSGPAEVLDLLHGAAVQATDTLVVYYAGHGLLDPHTDELYLALPDSSPERLYSALRFEDLRREMVMVAGAQSKVVILDCCYSGRAMAGGMSGSMEMADQARIDGTYLMTASAETVRAQAPVGEEFTAFTGELVTALSRGIPDGPDLLNVETLYWHVRKELVAKVRPTPQQRAGNNGGMIVLARNRRGESPGMHPARVHRALPELPAGSERFLHCPPRDIVGEVARLADLGRTDQADLLLSAVAFRRPDQELAVLVAAFREAGWPADGDKVIEAAVQRPAADVAALVGVQRQMGWVADSGEVLDAAARGAAEDVAAIAKILASSGMDGELHRLLDSAITGQPRPEGVIALVGALLSMGLGTEVDRLLDRATETMSEEEAAALADALRGAGRNEAAFRLYGAALGTVAGRPATAVASLLQALRDGNRDHLADELLSKIGTANRQAEQVMEIVRELWSVALDSDSDKVLRSAAAAMTPGQVMVLAGLLREADRYESAVLLCTESAAFQPAAGAATLVRALRDAGRPIDAYRIIDSTQAWPGGKSGELVTILRHGGDDADADRLLAIASTGAADQISDLIAALTGSNTAEDASHLIALSATRAPAHVAAIIGKLLRRNLKTEADRLLSNFAARSDEDLRVFLESLQHLDKGNGTDYLLRWQAQQPPGRVLRCLETLWSQNNGNDSRQLLGYFCARPIADIIALASVFPEDHDQDAALLTAGMARRDPHDAVAVIKVLQARNVDRDAFMADFVDEQPQRLVQIIALLQSELPGHTDRFMRAIATRRDAPTVASLIAQMRAGQLTQPMRELLQAAATHIDDRYVRNLDISLSDERQRDEADYLLQMAILNRPVSSVIQLFIWSDSPTPLLTCSRHMRSVFIKTAAQRSEEDVTQLVAALRERHRYPDARKLRQLSENHWHYANSQ